MTSYEDQVYVARGLLVLIMVLCAAFIVLRVRLAMEGEASVQPSHECQWYRCQHGGECWCVDGKPDGYVSSVGSHE